MSEIRANFHTLMNQAPGTVGFYLTKAIDEIDRHFGDGYAKKNPALLGAFLQATALDFGVSVLAQQVRLGLQEIAGGLGEIARAIPQPADAEFG